MQAKSDFHSFNLPDSLANQSVGLIGMKLTVYRTLAMYEQYSAIVNVDPPAIVQRQGVPEGPIAPDTQTVCNNLMTCFGSDM